MPRLVFFCPSLFLIAFAAGDLDAVETVVFESQGKIRNVTAEILVEAQDGGLMLQADDGRIWLVQPEEIKSRRSDDSKFQPVDVREMQRRMLEELPNGFRIHRTQHYLIVYNSNEAYAKRVGFLFEQLYKAFFAYWENQRWDLPEPEFPLVGFVLKDHRDFLRHARPEIGETANSLIGYYHLESNRVTTFNVPNWERNVATIIHEATHQLAYNCGLQRRFADNPMWVSEGLATFFESPDRRNPSRWQRVGRVNQVNLSRWRNYLPKRPSDSLMTLVTDDSRFRSDSTNAYAESWALTYFLIKTRREQYVAYLRALSQGKPLAERSQRERLELIESCFETKLGQLDRAFVAYMRGVRG